MAKIVKVQGPDGTAIEGEDIEFTPTREPWGVYQLEDGHTLRFKAVVIQVVKTEKRDDEGRPVYIIRSSNVLSVAPPETYKRKEIQ